MKPFEQEAHFKSGNTYHTSIVTGDLRILVEADTAKRSLVVADEIAAYLPKVLLLDEGQTWYVKVPDSLTVLTLEIVELSKHTVVFNTGRYCVSDVVWLEQLS